MDCVELSSPSSVDQKGSASNYNELLGELRSLVLDAPSLVAIIDNRQKSSSASKELRRLEAENKRQTKQVARRTAKAHASWVMFWREIVRDPSEVFAKDRATNTAWNLWRAMERSGQEESGIGLE